MSTESSAQKYLSYTDFNPWDPGMTLWPEPIKNKHILQAFVSPDRTQANESMLHNKKAGRKLPSWPCDTRNAEFSTEPTKKRR